MARKYTFHPAAAQYPLMADDELGELAESIRVNGQFVAAVAIGSQIIDGRNRYRACEMLGIDCWIVEYEGEPADVESTVEALNEHRRHLTQQWREAKRKERIERVAEARRNGKSLPAIAKQEGVSIAQVQRDLEAAATVQGCTVGASLPPGKDAPVAVERGGTSYVMDTTSIGKGKKPKAAPPPDDVDAIPFGPAAKPPVQAASDPSEMTAEQEQEAGENLIRMAHDGTLPVNLEVTVEACRPRDAVDLPIPDSMLEAFAASSRFDECRNLLRSAQKLIHEIAAGPGGGHLRGELSHKKGRGEEVRHYCEGIANALRKLSYARPYACTCPYCLDEPKPGCKSCQGKGWVVESCWDDAPEDYREAAADARRAAHQEAQP